MSKEKFRYIATAEDAGAPVKSIIRQKFNFSRRLRTKLKYGKGIFLNGEEAAGWIPLKEGDVITVVLPEETSHFPDEDIPVTPIYEDDDILLINKQAGVICHPTKGHPFHTMAGGVTKYMHDKGDEYKIRFINRLDMDTSGVLAIAKNSHGQDNLVKQMRRGEVVKKYLALVWGIVAEDEGTIDLPIGRPDPERVERGVIEGGSPSVTHFKVRQRIFCGGGSENLGYDAGCLGTTAANTGRAVDYTGAGGFTLLELKLETGRTHQIRVHLSYIGHPIVGDPLYGGIDCPIRAQCGFACPFRTEKYLITDETDTGASSLENTCSSETAYAPLLNRQALHAYYLAFTHPVTGELVEAEAPLAEDIVELLETVGKEA